MADHGEVEYATADGNDYAEHEGTYRLFIDADQVDRSASSSSCLILMAYFLV